jgi:hypothetical protein
MSELKISALYLDLANECFNKAAIEEHADGVEVFRRMGRRYLAEARVYDPLLSQKMASTNAASWTQRH